VERRAIFHLPNALGDGFLKFGGYKDKPGLFESSFNFWINRESEGLISVLWDLCFVD
jgi:hypothetical protein